VTPLQRPPTTLQRRAQTNAPAESYCLRRVANDRQKIFAFIRRCICTGFCSPYLADFHNLYISLDEKLFNKILTCPNHILRTLLPPPTAQNYSLRNRPHNRQLLIQAYILDLRFILLSCTTAVCAFSALTLLVGRQEGHPACKKLSGEVLAWLSVYSEVQTCIWPS